MYSAEPICIFWYKTFCNGCGYVGINFSFHRVAQEHWSKFMNLGRSQYKKMSGLVRWCGRNQPNVSTWPVRQLLWTSSERTNADVPSFYTPGRRLPERKFENFSIFKGWWKSIKFWDVLPGRTSPFIDLWIPRDGKHDSHEQMMLFYSCCFTKFRCRCSTERYRFRCVAQQVSTFRVPGTEVFIFINFAITGNSEATRLQSSTQTSRTALFPEHSPSGSVRETLDCYQVHDA